MTSWRGKWSQVQALGAELLLCSTDSAPALAVFAASLGGLPYLLGSDATRAAARAYGVLRADEVTAARSMFLIDADGILRYENRSFPAADPASYDRVLEAVQQLRV